MMYRVRIATASVILCVSAFVPVAAQQSAREMLRRPTVFSVENENQGFTHAAPPSDAVLDALLGSKKGQEASEYLDPLNRESKRRCFHAVRIDIRSEKDEDYIVNGSCPMLSGADNEWFWIVGVQQGKARVLLFCNGLRVDILRHRTNGYDDIKASWGGNLGWGDLLYQYDSSKYKLVRRSWHDAKP